MKINCDKCDINRKKLPIPPMKIPGKIEKIPISQIVSGKIQKESLSISKAVVAYLDILGFSEKIDD